MSIKTFTVTFPTEAGFIGRECNSSSCGRYFKVHEDSLCDHMYCPYCAEKFEKDQLYTKDQLAHAENQAAELAKEYMYGEIDKMFGNFTSRNRGGLIKFTHTPIRYKAKPVVARYKEREVDSELTCPECGVIFQVFGIFGFCPGCRSENQAIYDANLAIVRQEITRLNTSWRRPRYVFGIDNLQALHLAMKCAAAILESAKQNSRGWVNKGTWECPGSCPTSRDDSKIGSKPWWSVRLRSSGATRSAHRSQRARRSRIARSGRKQTRPDHAFHSVRARTTASGIRC